MAFVFQACYGPGPDYGKNCDMNVKGVVVSKSTNMPVEGIKVVAENLTAGFTDKDGRYDFFVAIPRKFENSVRFELRFQDTDGLQNRHFADTTIMVRCGCNEQVVTNVELRELPND